MQYGALPTCKGHSLHHSAVEAEIQHVKSAEADSSGSHVSIYPIAHGAALDSRPEPVGCLAHSLQPQGDCSAFPALCMARSIKVTVLHHIPTDCRPRE